METVDVEVDDEGSESEESENAAMLDNVSGGLMPLAGQMVEDEEEEEDETQL